MRCMYSKYLSFTVVLVLALSLFEGGARSYHMDVRSSPDLLQAPGLTAPVTVRRDERGIPYIEAASEEDAMFAQGYITASDRLWQMDLLRRTARGELAEILGRTALEEDKGHRTLGFALIAEKSALHLPKQLRMVLSAYARGVNAYISNCEDGSLPTEFKILKYRPREWRVTDSLVIGKLFAEMLSMTWTQDIMRATFNDVSPEMRERLLIETSPLDIVLVGRDYPKSKRLTALPSVSGDLDVERQIALLRSVTAVEQTMRESMMRVGLYAEHLAASNSWVVSGRHTSTGKPLLANDPHLHMSAPSIWHMVHLATPDLRVAGVTAPGVPGVVIGHNRWIAWGMTNLSADTQDVYIETFDPARPDHYKAAEGWQKAELRREEIKVRKSMVDSSIETYNHEVTTTRHGPVVLDAGGKRYSLKWESLDPLNIELGGFYELNRARNWKEFCAALSHYRGPAQNFVYADIYGHIGYYGAGKIPIRKTGYGDLPYNGEGDTGEWTGFIPFDQLPRLYDPPSGIIVTANNRVVGHSYPYLITKAWISPHRARRILDMLRAKSKLTMDDFRMIQGDVYSMSGVTFAQGVVKIVQGSADRERDESYKKTLRLFMTWDGKVTSGSQVTPRLWALRTVFINRILTFVIGRDRMLKFRWGNQDTLIDQLITEQPASWLPPEFKNYQEFLRDCHVEAHKILTKLLGPDESQWMWGERFFVYFPHPLSFAPFVGGQFKIAPFPQDGHGPSVGATPNVGGAVSMRFIADLSDWDRSQQGLPLGISGDPASAHWKDQLEDWKAVAPRAFPFNAKTVHAAAKQSTILSP